MWEYTFVEASCLSSDWRRTNLPYYFSPWENLLTKTWQIYIQGCIVNSYKLFSLPSKEYFIHTRTVYKHKQCLPQHTNNSYTNLLCVYNFRYANMGAWCKQYKINKVYQVRFGKSPACRTVLSKANAFIVFPMVFDKLENRYSVNWTCYATKFHAVGKRNDKLCSLVHLKIDFL